MPKPTDVVEFDIGVLPAPVRAMLEDAKAATDEPDVLTQVSALAAILNGHTAEDILSEQTVEKAKDWLDREFVIHDFRWHASDMKDGLGFFQSWDITTEGSDDHLILNNGAMTCMAQVYALKRDDLLPATVTLTQADKPTKNGYYPQRLVMVPPPFPDEP